MKIRILDDSIRLRLDRGEVDQIASGAAVAGETRFPSGASFGYALRAGGQAAHAEFGPQGIVVTLPTERLSNWAGVDEDVSIREELALADGGLKILVEKDFECLEPREGESQANRFANPKAQTG